MSDPAPTPVPEAQKRKTVIIALPGREFSGNFLVSWTKALHTLWANNYEAIVLNRFSSYVTFSRMQCLGPAHQKVAAELTSG